MMKITEVAGFNDVRVFEVDDAQVWLDHKGAKCTLCSGPLVGMSASCRHARAVKNLNRKPTPFEAKVLKMIKQQRGGFQSGDSQVQYVAAARRLERLGYAAKPGTRWWTTNKGDDYLKKLEEK